MRKSIIATAMLAVASLAYGQDSFDNIIDEIIANNPELSAKQADMKSQILDAKVQNNLDDTQVEFDHKWGVGDADNRWNLSVSQSFDWPGLYKARNQSIKQKQTAFNELYKGEIAIKSLEIKRLLIDIVCAKQRVNLLSAIVSNLDSLDNKEKLLFERGEATILDIKKLHLERFNYSVQLEEAQSALTAAKQSLYAINAGQYIATDGISSYPLAQLADESTYLDAVRSNDHTYVGMAQMLDAGKADIKAAKQEQLPGFSLGYVHEREGSESFNGFSVGVSLPLFSARHKVAAAMAKTDAQECSLTAYETSQRAKIIATYATAKKEGRQLNNYDAIINGDDYLKLLTKAYLGGELTTINFLLEVNYFISTQIDFINVQHSYQLHLADLNYYLQ
jgi:outer membrane protein TolC